MSRFGGLRDEWSPRHPRLALAALLLGLAACGKGAGPTAGAGPSNDGGAPDGAIDAGSNGDAGSGAGACGSGALTADEQILVNLPADSWYDVKGSSFLGSGVCLQGQPWSAIGGCGAVIDAWSGGAYDPVHDKMLIWGGGHADYWGNEVYSFNPATFLWKRETTPSDVTTSSEVCQDPYFDGKPASRHTYDGLAYLPGPNRFWSWAGGIAGSGNCPGVPILTWTLDLETQTWTNMLPTGSFDTGAAGFMFVAASAYDPSTRKVFTQDTGGLSAYDYAANSWAIVQDFGMPPEWPRYEDGGDKTAAIDTKRHLFFTFGQGDYFVFDIGANAIVTDDWITTGGGAFDNSSQAAGPSTIGQLYPNEVIHTGGGDVITADGPGLDYDPHADALVAWKGGAPYVLDLASKVWTTKSATGALATPSQNGVYGRFRYLAKYNVFILVNGPNDDVTFYKHTAGCGS